MSDAFFVNDFLVDRLEIFRSHAPHAHLRVPKKTARAIFATRDSMTDRPQALYPSSFAGDALFPAHIARHRSSNTTRSHRARKIFFATSSPR
jgi:hypothetical protein